MSMRNYAVFEKGLVLRYDNLEEFARFYKGGFDTIDEDESMQELLEDMKNGSCDSYSATELLEEIGFFEIGNFENGTFRKLYNNVNKKGLMYSGEVEYLGEEDSFLVLSLNKDTLFQKYRNLKELYKEIKKHLKKYGFEVSMKFLQNNVGEISGVSFG